MVEMEGDVDAWHEVLNVPGVAKFMGASDMPKPLSPKEVEDLFQQIGEAESTERIPVDEVYDIGEQVRVIDGPFSNFNGVVEEVSPEKGRLRIRVEIFGRSTPVELNFNQVGKI
jgi:transcriptional antiterminator NusG